MLPKFFLTGFHFTPFVHSFVLSCFLAPQDILGSSYISPAPALESIISRRSSCSFYWRIIFETKILVLNVLIATEISASRPSQWIELGNVFMCTNPSMYILYTSAPVCVFVYIKYLEFRDLGFFLLIMLLTQNVRDSPLPPYQPFSDPVDNPCQFYSVTIYLKSAQTPQDKGSVS